MILNKRTPLFRAALSIQNHRASITSRRSDNYNLHRVASPLLSCPPLSPLCYISLPSLHTRIARVRVLDALTPVDPSTGRTPRTIPCPAFLRPSLPGNIHPSSSPSAAVQPLDLSPLRPHLISPVSRGSAQGIRGRGKETEAHVYRLMMKIVQ